MEAVAISCSSPFSSDDAVCVFCDNKFGFSLTIIIFVVSVSASLALFVEVEACSSMEDLSAVPKLI